MRFFIAILVALFWCHSTLNAAEISMQMDHDNQLAIIAVSGAIVYGDEETFRTYAIRARKAVVVLSSKGGSTVSAIDIGKTIRLKGFATAVPSNVLCASACALIWLAGTPRFAERDSYIGFHASYINNNGILQESGVANALVGAYLTQLGFSERAVVFVTSAPPQGIEWINVTKARSVGIDVVPLQSEARVATTNKGQLGIRDEQYDPLSTVKAFYAALSAADGTAAAAVVIPEKRGIGPFNERNIAEFFGAMSRPLEITSMKRLGHNLVSVEYNYVFKNGKACNGAAQVTTTYKFGVTLIEGIKANC